ncbi:hypothetical protein YC2023_116292 [Brassica napus]
MSANSSPTQTSRHKKRDLFAKLGLSRSCNKMDGLLSCIGRSRKLEKSGSSFLCSRCVNPNVTGVIRYLVELSVDDGNDSTTFVVFECLILPRKMQLLWLLMRVNGGGGQELRECLKELAGKDFVFKIHIFNTTEGKGAFACASNMAAAGGKECGHKRSR